MDIETCYLISLVYYWELDSKIWKYPVYESVSDLRLFLFAFLS